MRRKMPKVRKVKPSICYPAYEFPYVTYGMIMQTKGEYPGFRVITEDRVVTFEDMYGNPVYPPAIHNFRRIESYQGKEEDPRRKSSDVEEGEDGEEGREGI